MQTFRSLQKKDDEDDDGDDNDNNMNSKENKNIRNVRRRGMIHQKVCKQAMDHIKVKVNIWSPISESLSHYTGVQL